MTIEDNCLPNLEIDNNKSLYYQLIKGDITKPYLIFLHEGLGCLAMWKDFPALLCRTTGCPGLIYDRVGYGKSSPLNHTRTIHYLHEYALHELPTLLDAVIPGTPYILIGHSDGGSISLIYGAERSPLLRGIITEAAHVFVDPETIAGVSCTNEGWENEILERLTKYHGEKTETMFKAWSETWLSNWFNYWNIEYLLPSIAVPLLVIQGADDQYGSIDQVNSIVSKSTGFALSEIVENCGHVPHLEARSVIIKLMSDFIIKIANGEGSVRCSL